MPTGLVTTYDLTEGVIVDIDPLIRLLSPTDTPLQSGTGNDGRTVLATDTCFEKKIEWQDDEILTPRSTVAATATTGDLVLTVASGDRLKFSTGDALLIGTQQVRVTDYGSTADTLHVSRSYAGTTAGTIAADAAIINLGANLPEGSDPEDARSRDFDNRHNLTQIFGPTAVNVSGTEQVIRKYGITTTMFDHQAARRMVEEKIKLEQALLNGVRFEDTSAKLRQLGGLSYFITVNVDTTSTELTHTALDTMIRTCFENGGNPNRLILSPLQKSKLSNLDSNNIRIARSDRTRGQVVDKYLSDHGELDIITHRWCRNSEAFVFNRDQAVIKTLRPWQFEMLAKTGDSVKGQIVGEKTLKFEADPWAGRFTALT